PAAGSGEATRLHKVLFQMDSPEAQDGIRETEEMARFDERLPGVLDGKDQPRDAVERLNFAQLCQLPYRKLYAAAARLSGEAFAGQPDLAEDLKASHR